VELAGGRQAMSSGDGPSGSVGAGRTAGRKKTRKGTLGGWGDDSDSQDGDMNVAGARGAAGLGSWGVASRAGPGARAERSDAEESDSGALFARAISGQPPASMRRGGEGWRGEVSEDQDFDEDAVDDDAYLHAQGARAPPARAAAAARALSALHDDRHFTRAPAAVGMAPRAAAGAGRGGEDAYAYAYEDEDDSDEDHRPERRAERAPAPVSRMAAQRSRLAQHSLSTQRSRVGARASSPPSPGSASGSGSASDGATAAAAGPEAAAAAAAAALPRVASPEEDDSFWERRRLSRGDARAGGALGDGEEVGLNPYSVLAYAESELPAESEPPPPPHAPSPPPAAGARPAAVLPASLSRFGNVQLAGPPSPGGADSPSSAGESDVPGAALATRESFGRVHLAVPPAASPEPRDDGLRDEGPVAGRPAGAWSVRSAPAGAPAGGGGGAEMDASAIRAALARFSSKVANAPAAEEAAEEGEGVGYMSIDSVGSHGGDRVYRAASSVDAESLSVSEAPSAASSRLNTPRADRPARSPVAALAGSGSSVDAKPPPGQPPTPLPSDKPRDARSSAEAAGGGPRGEKEKGLFAVPEVVGEQSQRGTAARFSPGGGAAHRPPAPAAAHAARRGAGADGEGEEGTPGGGLLDVSEIQAVDETPLKSLRSPSAPASRPRSPGRSGFIRGSDDMLHSQTAIALAPALAIRRSPRTRSPTRAAPPPPWPPGCERRMMCGGAAG
jgi:hypothetical protein